MTEESNVRRLLLEAIGAYSSHLKDHAAPLGDTCFFCRTLGKAVLDILDEVIAVERHEERQAILRDIHEGEMWRLHPCAQHLLASVERRIRARDGGGVSSAASIGGSSAGMIPPTPPTGS